MKMNFDKEIFTRQVLAFREANNRYPYIICSKKTKECFPEKLDIIPVPTMYINYCNIDTTLSTASNKDEQPKESYEMYSGCKVYIDNTLDYGEVVFV